MIKRMTYERVGMPLMKSSLGVLLLTFSILGVHVTAAHAQEQQLNILCSVQSDWCNLIQVTFPRVTGIKVNILQRSTGEALAQVNAEKANPKIDIWFGEQGIPTWLLHRWI